MKKITGVQLFQIPNIHLPKLASMKPLLTPQQIRDLVRSFKLDDDMMFKITQKQVGNGIGTLIASIGIPMLLNALTGKGEGRGGQEWVEGGQGFDLLLT